MEIVTPHGDIEGKTYHGVSLILMFQFLSVKDKGGQVERNIAKGRNIAKIIHLSVYGVVGRETLEHDVR